MHFVTLPPPDDRPNEVIVGASTEDDDEIVGLAIAHLPPNTSSAKLHSVVVAAEHRHKGLGTMLIAALEDQLVSRGAKMIDTIYDPNISDAPFVKKMLDRRGFAHLPELVMCRGSRNISAAPWMKLEPPRSDHLFPWTELRDDEARAIEGFGLPSELDPFKLHVEPINSFGVRNNGVLIGWVLAERPGDNLVSYSSVFVRPESRAHARGIAFVAEAIRRQFRGGIDDACFSVRRDNAPMMRLLERRIQPFLDSVSHAAPAKKTLVTGARL